MIEKKKLKFEAEGREFAKVLRSLEQFVRTVKGQNNLLVPGGFSDIIKIDQLEFKLEKILAFRNMQEKLENR